MRRARNCWLFSLVFTGLLLAQGPALAQGKTIVLVSDSTSLGAPPNSYDDSLIELLESAGYFVDKIGMDRNFREGATSPWAAGNEAKLDALESADLVLVSRRTDSASYDEDRQRWNELEVPLVLMSGYITRGAGDNRWGWHDSGSGNAAATASDATVEPGQEDHPFLEFHEATIPVVDLSTAPNGQIPKAFYLPSTDLVPSATVLARLDGRPFLAEIPAGVDLDAETPTGVGPYGVTGERRVFLGAWGYDINVNDNPDTPYQFADFTTAEYRCLLLNVIREVLGEDLQECEEDVDPVVVTRRIESDLCQSSEVVITLSASNLFEDVTIVETFPESAIILDDGGGADEDNKLIFQVTPEGDGSAEVSYSLQVSDIHHRISGVVTLAGGGTRVVEGDRLVERCPDNIRAHVILVSDAVSTGVGNAINDDSLVLMLEEAGYSVDISGMDGAYKEAAWDPLEPADEGKVDALLEADLVIVSRRTVSGDYDDDRQFWNELDTPMLLMSGYFTRGAVDNRWGWQDGGSADLDLTLTTIDLEPGQEDHPFVAGLPDSFAVVDLESAPIPFEIPKSFFLPLVEPVAEATVIARMAGAPFLFDVPAGVDLDALSTGGGPYGVTGERRVFLAAWGYDVTIPDPITAEDVPAQFTLFTTEEYRCLVLNTVSQMLDLGPDPCVGAPSDPEFRRGDSNADGQLNITDGIYVLNFLFLGGETPSCLEAADGNDDGQLNITDGIFVLNFLFLGGPEPPAPGPADCGPDESAEFLGCDLYPGC